MCLANVESKQNVSVNIPKSNKEADQAANVVLIGTNYVVDHFPFCSRIFGFGEGGKKIP